MLVFFELRRFLIVLVYRLEIDWESSTGLRGFAYPSVSREAWSVIRVGQNVALDLRATAEVPRSRVRRARAWVPGDGSLRALKEIARARSTT